MNTPTQLVSSDCIKESSNNDGSFMLTCFEDSVEPIDGVCVLFSDSVLFGIECWCSVVAVADITS